MAPYQIDKKITIEMGHRLPNHNGKCSSLHGHSYQIKVFVESPGLSAVGSTEGMVRDFAELKEGLNNIDLVFDHSMVLCIDDVMLKCLMQNYTAQYIQHIKEQKHMYHVVSGINGTRLVIIRRAPTAEVLATVWLNMLTQHISSKSHNHSYVSKIKVKETKSSCATVKLADGINFADYLLTAKDGSVS